MLKAHVVLSNFLIAMALFCAVAQAEEATSTLLDEADKLVEIVPERSQKIAQTFLSSRTLVSKDNVQTQSHSSRDDIDRTLRTPSASIKAMQIIADAKYILGDSRGALANLEQAQSIAVNYNLPYLETKVLLHKATLLLHMTSREDRVTPLIAIIEERLNSNDLTVLATQLRYQLLMLKANVEAVKQNDQQALDYYAQAHEYLAKIDDDNIELNYHIVLGQYYLTKQNYNRALYYLLSAYWSAIEKDKPILLAKINNTLARLFLQKNIPDKALEHFSQSADFYDNYGDSSLLSDILKNMADIYYHQGRYNLALVHYFNVLDSAPQTHNVEQLIELHLALAKTYLQLYNYPLAEQYLQRANTLLTYANIDTLKASSFLLSAEMLFLKSEFDKSIALTNKALSLGQQYNDIDIQRHAYLLLTHSYEAENNYSAAYSNGKHYNELITAKLKKQLAIAEDDFREQKSFIEQSLHFKDQSKLLAESNEEKTRYRYSTTLFFVVALCVFILFLHRRMVNTKLKEQLQNLYNDYYTHPRSGLRNFRLLNARLPTSLEQSSAHFEQWKTGELINEPLHDKLRFVMIEVPFLRTSYMQKGYHAGLNLERDFGEFITTKLHDTARLYQFSDGLFLYIEPNKNPDKTAVELFEQLRDWITEFSSGRNLNRIVRAGIVDYPFLPKAYTAINDKELIDILLVASNIARLQNHLHDDDQWVYLKAIENAPAASFASGNIRGACLEAIEKGLIKVESGHKIEENLIKSSIID